MSRKLYNIENLLKYVIIGYDIYLSMTEAGTEEEREKDKKRKDILRARANVSYAGMEQDRELVKQFIYRLITGDITIKTDKYPTNYKINEETINNVVNWNNTDTLPVYIKYLILIYYYKRVYGRDALGYIIEKYELNNLREDKSITVTSQDIFTIYNKEKIELTYKLKTDILTQILYEEFKGNSCIDEIVYQNVDDIQIGVSGVQDDIEIPQLDISQIPKAYESVWIKYKGMLMYLKFLSFQSFENLRRVVEQGVAYEQQGSFSQKEGYKMGNKTVTTNLKKTIQKSIEE